MSERKTAKQSGAGKEVKSEISPRRVPEWATPNALLISKVDGSSTSSFSGPKLKKAQRLSEAQEHLLYQVVDGGCSALVSLRARWLLRRNSAARSFLLDYYAASDLTRTWCSQSFPSSKGDGDQCGVNWEDLWGRISAGIDQLQGVAVDDTAVVSNRTSDLDRSGAKGFADWWREWRGATVVGTALASILFIVYSQDNQISVDGIGSIAKAPISDAAPEGRPVLARSGAVFDARKVNSRKGGAAANVVAVNASSKPRKYYSTDIYGGQPVARQLGRYVIPGRDVPVRAEVASSQGSSALSNDRLNNGDWSELLEVGPRPLETVVASSVIGRRSNESALTENGQAASQLASNSVGRSSKLSAHELDWLRSQGAINIIPSSSGKGGVLWVSRK